MDLQTFEFIGKCENRARLFLRGYDSLMFCGYRHLQVDHGKLFSSGKVYINGLEGFWSYAKERLIKFHGVSKEKFPL